ncbi:amino acid adenylation domain-containing protein [Streptomyces sp. NPDC001941]|uniref:non-ribosomal peptide synthetase n=1 Tax=Streptomyces sp. NPDC001941 TaxID=3154659 RepID=UPI00331E56E5
MSVPTTSAVRTPVRQGGREPSAVRWRLAPNQADLYVADRIADAAGTYTVCFAFRMERAGDPVELQSNLERLLEMHPVLGCRVGEDSQGWFLEPSPTRPRITHLTTPLPADGPHAQRRIRHLSERPLDPRQGPMIRVALLPHTDGTADLLVVAHHLAVDEGSTALLGAHLLGLTPPEPRESYATWTERAHGARSAAADRALELRAGLAGADWEPDLTWARHTRGPVRPARGVEGATVEVTLDATAWGRVRAAAAGQRLTPYSFALAAAALVLARNSGAESPVLGATVSRRSPRHHATIGYFNTTVAIPVDTGGSPTVGAFLARTHQRSLSAYRDADVPLSAVLPEGSTGPRLVVVPVPQLPTLVDGDRDYPARPAARALTAQFPLALYLHEEADGSLRAVLRHQLAAVDAGAAALYARQFRHTLEALAAHDADDALDNVVTLADADRRQAARLGLGERADATATAAHTLPALFDAQVRRAPERTAVTCGPAGVDYAELDARTTGLARALVERGVVPGDRVGVCLPRGIDQVTALLAVLKSGAAYVPLDPDYPAERLAFIAEDTSLKAVIGDAPLSGARTVPVTARGAASVPLPVVSPDSLAYVIHTSGSTGHPKGVQVTHRNVVSLLAATAGEFGLGPQDVWTHFHSFAFDFSVWEIWGCLLTGGRLVVVPYEVSRDPEELLRLLGEEAVTVLNQTPSAFTQLVAAERFAAGDLAVRLLVFGGEALDPAVLLPWFDRYPESRCRPVNMYGITETTVHCTWHDLTRADALRGSCPVGRPLPGWQLHVLDPRGRPTPVGVPGEIHVGGAGVSAGYLDRPELDAERFVTGLLDEDPTLRLYRSGDRGRYLPDGSLEHLGRLDDQVKIRGHRIELGEIRGQLLADPHVAAAAVLVRRPGDAATARIDAYVVLTDPAHPGEEVHRRLAERLPAHLLPAAVTAVPALPLTANGKLDLARLPEPAPRGAPPSPGPAGPRVPGADAAPGTGENLAVRLAGVWQDVLEVPVGVDDNFFELGGNSLLAVRLSSALKDQGFAGIQLRSIFRHSTPRRLADALTDHRSTR